MTTKGFGKASALLSAAVELMGRYSNLDNVATHFSTFSLVRTVIDHPLGLPDRYVRSTIG